MLETSRTEEISHEASAFEYMVINLARFIRPNEITFSGVNSTFPMLACLLAKRAYDFPFTYINVAGGVDPEPASVPISSSDPILTTGTASIFDNEDFYDLSCRGGMDLSFLGAAQVDGRGRTNNSAIGPWTHPKVRLPGGGGAAVMLPTAKRCVTWRTEHSKRTLVDDLDFVTADGGMNGLVTPLAVFELIDGALTLKSFNPASSLDAIRERTGFTISTSGVEPTPPPTSRELEALRSLDPEGAIAADNEVSVQ
ncbi:CoA-transferase subunit beta [Brevibacterium sp. CFH 10365]|uniref:CoA-transferase subunit beta n=1 Tax=Brevibacterium sp. CFH 10365 TaxID=2585207 RepID=UPI001D0D1AE5|nr:CoA-transferase [Brevibacterium sp. CFH 10365]